MGLGNNGELAFETTKYKISKPPFVVDEDACTRDTGRQIDWTLLSTQGQFQRGATRIQVNGAAAADATTVNIDAPGLLVPLKKGDIIQLGLDKYITLTADAPIGAVALTVEPLTTALADNDVGYTAGLGGYRIPAGTEMDLLTSGKIVPSVLNTGGGVTAYGLLISPADQDVASDAITGYGVYVQGHFYENLLPGASGSPKVINSTFKTELLNRGGSWMFTQYSDSTA